MTDQIVTDRFCSCKNPKLNVTTAWGWKSVGIRCRKCNEHRIVKLSKKEQGNFRRNFARSSKNGYEIHKLWFDFCKRFMGDHGTFLYVGHDLSNRIERWAKKHLEVIVLGCDDNVYASSRVFLIPHKIEGYFHGTTWVVVPQLEGQPTVFFTYKEHVEGFLTAIKALHAEHKKPQRKENNFDELMDWSIPWNRRKLVSY